MRKIILHEMSYNSYNQCKISSEIQKLGKLQGCQRMWQGTFGVAVGSRMSDDMLGMAVGLDRKR